MVMEGLDVKGPTGGTVGVVGGAAEVASGVGIGGAVCAGSSPCSGCGGTGGATMEKAPRVRAMSEMKDEPWVRALRGRDIESSK